LYTFKVYFYISTCILLKLAFSVLIESECPLIQLGTGMFLLAGLSPFLAFLGRESDQELLDFLNGSPHVQHSFSLYRPG